MSACDLHPSKAYFHSLSFCKCHMNVPNKVPWTVAAGGTIRTNK